MPKLLSNLLEHTNKANKVVKFNVPHLNKLIRRYLPGYLRDSTVVKLLMSGNIKQIKGYAETIECLKIYERRLKNERLFERVRTS